jgi:parallel beta-helix repeat protein
MMIIILLAIFLLIPNEPFLIDISKSHINTLATPTSPQVSELIDINGNTEFDQQATDNSWDGNGTAASPYIIDSYSFNLGGDLDVAGALVQNTDRHFIMRNCYWHAPKAWSENSGGFKFVNVTNGRIETSSVTGAPYTMMAFDGSTYYPTQWAVWLEDCINCTIDGLTVNSYYSSTLHPVFLGIELRNNHNINITNCAIEAHIDIRSYNTTDLTTSKNDLTGPQSTGYPLADFSLGIQFINTSYSTLSDNMIYNSNDKGIEFLSASNNNTIYGNIIHDCTNYGVTMTSTNFTTLSGNTFYNCGLVGIHLTTAKNGTFMSNIIYNTQVGMGYIGSINNTISDNTVHDCGAGVILEACINNRVSDNIIYDITLSHGLRLMTGCSNNTVSNNTIHDIFNSDGFWMSDACHNNTVSDNTIYETAMRGMYLPGNKLHNTFSGNTIYNCSSQGIFAGVNCNNSTFSGNTIYNCSDIGIFLVASSFTKVSWNRIFNNTNYGVVITSPNGPASYNLVNWNYFLGNNPGGTSQAFDDQLNNSFSYNYWDDHTGPDSEPDGIVDTPYGIDGGSNEDSFPRVTPVPLVTIESPIASVYTIPTISVSLSGNAIHYCYYIEGVDTQNQTWTENLNRTLMDGTYTLHVFGNDPVGYTVHTMVTFTIEFLSVLSPLSQDYITDTITVLLAGNALHYWYFIDPIDPVNQTWTSDVNRTLPDGNYTFHAYGNDTEGTIIHSARNFFLDANAPSIEVLSPISSFYTQNTITFTYTISDITEVAVTIYINGVANVTTIPSGSTSPFPDRDYNITIIAVDQIGHIGKISIIFTVDTNPPTINIDSPTATTYPSGNIAVTLSGDAEVYWYYIEGVDGSNQTWTSTKSRNLADGIYILHAYGNDSAGNVAHKSVTFTIGTPTTTTHVSTSETISTSTTEPKKGSFPGFFSILLFIALTVIFFRRYKRS